MLLLKVLSKCLLNIDRLGYISRKIVLVLDHHLGKEIFHNIKACLMQFWTIPIGPLTEHQA